MNRSAVLIDRTATLVVGLLLLLLGAAAIVWYLVGVGWVGSVPGVPGRLRTTGLQDVAATTWWPWALGAAGVVLILLGLRWAAAHLPDRGVGRLRLAGSGSGGRLEIDADAVAAAAADSLERCEGVRSARGRVVRERGQLLVSVRATVEHGADLAVVGRAGDAVSTEVAEALGRDDLRCSVRLHVAHRDRGMPRAS